MVLAPGVATATGAVVRRVKSYRIVLFWQILQPTLAPWAAVNLHFTLFALAILSVAILSLREGLE